MSESARNARQEREYAISDGKDRIGAGQKDKGANSQRIHTGRLAGEPIKSENLFRSSSLFTFTKLRTIVNPPCHYVASYFVSTARMPRTHH